MAYEKLFNEIYAAISLEYLWPEYQPCFVKSESPDWINEKMGLGLEVSQALLPGDGQTESFLEQYLGCRKEELPQTAFERYGARLHFYNGRLWAVLSEEDGEQVCMYKAQYRFEQKLEKLNAHYQRMRQNGLYLFLHPGKGVEIDAELLFQEMKKSQSGRMTRFDLVFLNEGSRIDVCDFRADRIEEIPLPGQADLFLNQEAERLRYLTAWEAGTSLEGLTQDRR